MSLISKLISGGQTGADRGGLEAARLLGIPTGGTAPRGWRTDEGPAPELGSVFGLIEHLSPSYVPRTEANVRDADVTWGFGDQNSPGMTMTRKCATRLERWYVPIIAFSAADRAAALRAITALGKPVILNIAGNRERTYPGMRQRVIDFIVTALRPYYVDIFS